MNKPKPLGELLYLTIQNLFYYSWLSQEEYLKNNMQLRLDENCTISLNGPRGAGWTFALAKFLAKDARDAIVISHNSIISKNLEKEVKLITKEDRNHLFISAQNPDAARGFRSNIIIYHDCSLINKANNKSKLEAIHYSSFVDCNNKIKFLIELH